MKREIAFVIKNYKISLDILFILLVLTMLVVGYLAEFLIALTSIFLHELGHILVSIYLGCKISDLRVLPVGMNAVIDDKMCCIREKTLINLSGPLINFLLVFFSLLVSLSGLIKWGHMTFLVWINIYLLAFNLLPVLPLDGGRILRDVMSEKFGIFFATKFVKRFSILISVLIIILGILQLLQDKHNFSLLVIGVYIISSSSFKKMEAAVMNIKSVIYRRSRLLKKGIYAARDLVVVKTMPMSELLKSMDFDRFHIIHVLDEELRLVKIYTEQEIIDGMLKYDTDMTFDEFMKRSS